MSSREQREKAAAQNKRNTVILNKLMALPENSTCVDCNEQGRPTWASWNLGAFLCIQCSGIHRSLGVHISKVRSVTLDKWDPEWIASMERGGNGKCNAEWEYHLPKSFKKLSSNSPALERFIRDKYEKRLWHRSSPAPPNADEICAKYHSMSSSGGGFSEMSYMSQSTSSYQDGYTTGGGRKSSGNYSGFGSNGQSHKMSRSEDDVLANAMASLSSGWTSFAKSATEIAAVAAEKTKELGEQLNENVIAPAREKLADPDLLTNVQEKIKGVMKTSSRGSRNNGSSNNNNEDFFASYGMDESSGYSRDEVNRSVSNKDSYFASLQSRNSGRPDNLPPSQGGKYAGFGSSSFKSSSGGDDGNYSKEELEKSSANKDSFFASLQAKNASRPDNLPPSKGGKYAGFGSSSFQNSGNGDYAKEDLERSAANKDSFFSSLTAKNAARSEDLPPSQGGKYVGFGSGSSASRMSSNSSRDASRSSSRNSNGKSQKPKNDADDWGNDWGDDGNNTSNGKSVAKRASKSKKPAATKKSAKTEGWDEDGWGNDW